MSKKTKPLKVESCTGTGGTPVKMGNLIRSLNLKSAGKGAVFYPPRVLEVQFDAVWLDWQPFDKVIVNGVEYVLKPKRRIRK